MNEPGPGTRPLKPRGGSVSSAYESADLLMKLYELRREPTMRQARQWFASFVPESADDVAAVMRGEHSAYFRMVTSFWDMAASFVNNGAIDEKMFNDANGEQIFVFARLEPFLAEYRAKVGQPHYLTQLEQLVMRLPNAQERLAHMRERIRAIAARTAQV
jgi:hypothetical protein